MSLEKTIRNLYVVSGASLLVSGVLFVGYLNYTPNEEKTSVKQDTTKIDTMKYKNDSVEHLKLYPITMRY